MKKKLVVGNWKMNTGVRESIALARGVILSIRGKRVIPDIVLCPPFVSLSEVRKVVARSKISLGAQDVFWEESGSYTGEISPRMLTEVGCSYVIVGHSERRKYMSETDSDVHTKAMNALKNNLMPIICVGENIDERRRGESEKVVERQVRAAVRRTKPKQQGLIVAYEPIWAIGSGNPATPQDAVSIHELIRKVLKEELSDNAAKSSHILYGGSVDGENSYSFLREPAIDGVLVGGASVKIRQFSEIINAATDAMEGQAGSKQRPAA